MEGKGLNSKMEKKRGREGGKERGAETIRECFMMLLITGLHSAFQRENIFLQKFQALSYC